MKRLVAVFLSSLLGVCSISLEAHALELRAIVPDHVGLTLQKSPVLYYFLSSATALPVRFTLRDDRLVHPLVEVQLPSPSQPGFRAIRLQDYKIELEEGVEYKWFVSVIRDANSPSKDIVAGGVIERAGLDEMIVIDDSRGPCDKDQMFEPFRSGIWYDGVACLHKLIEANPDDASLRRLRERVYRELQIHEVPGAPLLGECRDPYDGMPVFPCPLERFLWFP